MLRTIILSLLLIGCGPTENNQTESATAVEIQTPEESHYYSVHSDGEYGYERALSEDDKKAGQVASTVMLFKYLGTKNGLYQVMHTESEGVDVVIECENPCKFMRAYTLVDYKQARKEMIAATAGTIGSMVIADAIGGKLQPYIFGDEGLQHTMWFSNSRMSVTMTKDTRLSRQEREALGVSIEGGEQPEQAEEAAVAEKPVIDPVTEEAQAIEAL